jgi:two-component system cell cycle sensor histidine kinase/response regulator CckA
MNATWANSPKADSALSAPNRETILVVDDHPALCEVARILLKRCGYRVLIAYDASQAKEMVRDNPHIDLLLTDIEMPGMPGDQLAEWFHATCPHAAVVFMSGNATHQHQLPGYRFIEKPFVHLDTLVATILEAIHPTGAARHAATVAA